VCRPSVGRTRYSRSVRPERILLWTRDPEAEVLPTCEELGIGFGSWSPLGQGFLTGKVDAAMAFDTSDVRSWFPRFTPDARKANQPIVDLLRDIAGGRRRHLLKSRLLGCWPKSRGSFPSRARESWSVWTRTVEQLQSNSHPTTSVRSTQPPQRSRCKGLGDWTRAIRLRLLGQPPQRSRCKGSVSRRTGATDRSLSEKNVLLVSVRSTYFVQRKHDGENDLVGFSVIVIG